MKTLIALAFLLVATMKTLIALAFLLVAGCGSAANHSASPLSHSAATCAATSCTSDADCGPGLGCATDGTCGIVCGNGDTVCPSDTLCDETNNCLTPCRFVDGSVFYLDAVPAGYCPPAWVEEDTGRCFLGCYSPECANYGGVNACDQNASRSQAKTRLGRAR